MKFWIILGSINLAVIGLALLLCRKSGSAMADSMSGLVFWFAIAVACVADLVAALVHWL
jgi:hypothetical protein